MYGSKIKTNKIWSIVFQAYPPNFINELTEISGLKLEKYFDRFIEICNKYEEGLSKFGELIYEGIKKKNYRFTFRISFEKYHRLPSSFWSQFFRAIKTSLKRKPRINFQADSDR